MLTPGCLPYFHLWPHRCCQWPEVGREALELAVVLAVWAEIQSELLASLKGRVARRLAVPGFWTSRPVSTRLV